jgi:hypothetical protein
VKRAVFVALLLATSAFAADGGKATGKFLVGQDTRKLTHAYVIEENALLRVILATGEVDEAARTDTDALREAVAEGELSALVIQLDEDRQADTTYFFDAELPAGLEVREWTQFTAKKSNKGTLSGRLVLTPHGNSFSYEATFDAPIVKFEKTVEPLPADATPKDHALWRLEQKGLPFEVQVFRNAVLEDDADTVDLYLTAGMPAESIDALRLAVDTGKAKVVKLLLARGEDKNGKDDFGQPLVMIAASNHHVDVMEMLIAAGADVNAANQYHITPLAVAAEQGHLDEVKLLLEAGANVNARDTAGSTALTVAILRGYTEIVETLITAGTDVLRDKDDLLSLAAEKPDIKAMLEKAIAAAEAKP